jgi:hypothetical protein
MTETWVITGEKEVFRLTRNKGVDRHALGLIAEDESDVETVAVLARRIAKNPTLKIRHFVGRGCGKIKQKCRKWAMQLQMQSCNHLILVHDRDDRDSKELGKSLSAALDPCPIPRHLICIPTIELEAWLIGDPQAIKEALNLKRLPKVDGLPESIQHPKEYLEHLVTVNSEGERYYINTKHNRRIAEKLSLERVQSRCPSFGPFVQFVEQHLRSK